MIAYNSFTRNRAGGQGGAIYFQAEDVGFHNNTFVNNHADVNGGACAFFYTGSAPTNISSVNNLFANNSANRGGAVYTSGRKLRIVNNTIVNNIDTAQAGGVVLSPTSGREAVVINSILWGNQSLNTFNEQFSTGQSFNTYFYNCDVQGGVGGLGGTGNFDSNPLFVNASSGPGSHINALSANWRVDSCTSPVIDAGDRDTIFDSEYQEFDLAGNFRNTRGTIDVGAYESFGTSNEGAWTSGPICGSDSNFTIWAWHPRGIAPNSTLVQADTGAGWFTVNNAMFPEVNISNDTIFFTNAPLDFSGAPGRVINVYSCFSDTTPAWNPEVIATTYDTVTIYSCSNDSVYLGGAWQNTSDFYIDTLVNDGGCDSILTTELVVYLSPEVDVFDTICFGESFVWNGNTYSQSGEYDDVRFIFYPSIVCDSVTRLHLFVRPNLAPAAADTTIGCIGQPVTFDLTDPNLVSYSWSDGTNTGIASSFSITPSNFWERVFVTVTDVNGCSSNITRDFLEFQFDAYATQTDQSNDPFIEFSFAVGPPTNASDLYWDFGDGDTSHQATVTHEYTSNGNYNWCVYLDGLCGLDSTCSSIGIFAVSIEDYTSENWEAYPNPVHESLFINLKQSESAKIRILNLSGAMVFEEELSGIREHALRLSELASGVYLLEYESEDEKVSLKLVKD